MSKPLRLRDQFGNSGIGRSIFTMPKESIGSFNQALDKEFDIPRK